MSRLVQVPSRGMIPERDMDKPPVLECHHLGIEFGGLKAVDDLDLLIGSSEIAGLIGPNGAGKPRCLIFSPKSMSRRAVQFC